MGRELERGTAALEALDLRNCGLGPVGVAAVFHGLGARRRAGGAGPRVLDLGLNDLGELGVASLAAYLRADARLERLSLRAASLPRSTTAAMEQLALAFEANGALVSLDARDARVPAKVAHALRRTLEKRPTAPLPLASKLAFLVGLRGSGGPQIDEDSLRLVFGFARSPRTLRLDARAVDALADLFPLASPEARDLVDKMESGDFDIANEDDLAEINGVLARLDEADPQGVSNCARQLPREFYLGPSVLNESVLHRFARRVGHRDTCGKGNVFGILGPLNSARQGAPGRGVERVCKASSASNASRTVADEGLKRLQRPRSAGVWAAATLRHKGVKKRARAMAERAHRADQQSHAVLLVEIERVAAGEFGYGRGVRVVGGESVSVLSGSGGPSVFV